jgi:hypothetical protein
MSNASIYIAVGKGQKNNQTTKPSNASMMARGPEKIQCRIKSKKKMNGVEFKNKHQV